LTAQESCELSWEASRQEQEKQDELDFEKAEESYKGWLDACEDAWEVEKPEQNEKYQAYLEEAENAYNKWMDACEVDLEEAEKEYQAWKLSFDASIAEREKQDKFDPGKAERDEEKWLQYKKKRVHSWVKASKIERERQVKLSYKQALKSNQAHEVNLGDLL